MKSVRECKWGGTGREDNEETDRERFEKRSGKGVEKEKIDSKEDSE